MAVSPILAVIRDIHSSAEEGTNCPLNSNHYQIGSKTAFQDIQ